MQRNTDEMGSPAVQNGPGAAEPAHPDTTQLDLFGLMPGAPGGRQLRDLRGREYFQELGRRGGQQTVNRYGPEHMHDLAQQSATERRRRRYTLPRTVRTWYGAVERCIPYWPVGSRRKKPLYVYIQRDEEVAV